MSITVISNFLIKKFEMWIGCIKYYLRIMKMNYRYALYMIFCVMLYIRMTQSDRQEAQTDTLTDMFQPDNDRSVVYCMFFEIENDEGNGE